MVRIATFILDDDPDVLDAVKVAVERMGIVNYKLFTNWQAFVDGLNEDIHVIVIDHLLVQKTGLDVLKVIKQKNKSSFVIVYTGYTKEDIIIDYMNNDANRWVKKSDPLQMEKLTGFIQQGLEESVDRLNFFNEIRQGKKLTTNGE